MSVPGVPLGYEIVRIGAPRVGDFYLLAADCVDQAQRNHDATCYPIVRKLPPPQPEIDPGEGWRLLEVGEKIVKGDERFTGQCWKLSDCAGQVHFCGGRVRRRIAPKYRAFADAAEFMPHYDRQIRTFGDGGEIVHKAFHASSGQLNFVDWDWWLDHGTFVDDGTPCGVKE